MECHLSYGSQSATCHLTLVNIIRLNPRQTGCYSYSIYLSRYDGRLSWPRWLVTNRDGLPIKESFLSLILWFYRAVQLVPIGIATAMSSVCLSVCLLKYRDRTGWVLVQRPSVFLNKKSVASFPCGRCHVTLSFFMVAVVMHIAAVEC